MLFDNARSGRFKPTLVSLVCKSAKQSANFGRGSESSNRVYKHSSERQSPKKHSQPVCDDARALMFPQGKNIFRRVALDTSDVQHAFPDAGQIAQIKHIVELGRSRQHFCLLKSAVMVIKVVPPCPTA